MIFLHTSDWHLGATEGEYDLLEDQYYFVDEQRYIRNAVLGYAGADKVAQRHGYQRQKYGYYG